MCRILAECRLRGSRQAPRRGALGKYQREIIHKKIVIIYSCGVYFQSYLRGGVRKPLQKREGGVAGLARCQARGLPPPFHGRGVGAPRQRCWRVAKSIHPEDNTRIQ